jgi:hypothetical protein
VAERDRLPQGGVFSGLTAAWLYDVDCLRSERTEVTVPHGVGEAERVDFRVFHGLLAPGDKCTCHGLPVTSPERTCFDLARRLTLVEAVVVLDRALHDGLVVLEQLERYIAARAGWAGVRQARQALDLAEPGSESPMETRLRMVLVLRGLPRPQVQPTIWDRSIFVARPDLYYPQVKLGIEYDGGNHRDRLIEDNRRQNRLVVRSIALLRYTSSDVYQRPDAVAAEVLARIRE